jgi:hypothetical protein
VYWDFLNETLVKPLEFEAYTVFQGLTLNADVVKYDSYMEFLEYLSHFLPELDTGNSERRAL